MKKLFATLIVLASVFGGAIALANSALANSGCCPGPCCGSGAECCK